MVWGVPPSSFLGGFWHTPHIMMKLYVLAVSYSPTTPRLQYHQRSQA